MAKKQTKQEAYDAFITEILSKVPETEQEGIKAALTHAAVADHFADGVARQSDYSRAMDGIAEQTRQLEAFMTRESQKVKDWEAYATDALTKAAKADEDLAKYRQTYGDLTATPPPGMQKADIEALLESKLGGARKGLDEWLVQSVDALTDLKIDHRDRFKERLDTAELTKFARDKGYTTIDSAYSAYIAPKVEAAREADFKLKMDEAVKQAREEGRKAAISERLPGGGATRSLVADPPKDAVVRDERDRVARATQTLETLLAGR